MRQKKYWGVWLFWLSFSLIWFSPALGAEAKNVILLIGDGMGPESVGLAIYYNRFMNGMEKRLAMRSSLAFIQA